MTPPPDRLAEALRLAEAIASAQDRCSDIATTDQWQEPSGKSDAVAPLPLIGKEIARLLREEIAARSERERIAVEALRAIQPQLKVLLDMPREELVSGRGILLALHSIARRALATLAETENADG